MNRSTLVVIALFFFSNLSFGQVEFRKKESFIDPPDSLNKKRLATVIGGSAASYTASLIGLNYAWYKDFERTSFHFFNDNKEWLQIDKLSHIYVSQGESVIGIELLKWTGMERKKAIWYGGLYGVILQTPIEFMDGFSAKWGASPGDFSANILGSALVISQYLAWDEQRILLKTSYHKATHMDAQLQAKSDELYGSNPFQTLLKDYNEMNFWLSMNLSDFNPRQIRAKWLNVAVGYGASGLYGGFANVWIDENGNVIDRSDVPRVRKLLLSVDVDLTKFKAKSRVGKIALQTLSYLKFPAPAFEINTKGEILFHPIYFLNWNMPFTLRKGS